MHCSDCHSVTAQSPEEQQPLQTLGRNQLAGLAGPLRRICGGVETGWQANSPFSLVEMSPAAH